ncbi:probable methyltransferase-like protein 24 isoform X2 [Mercenaria mercenaria]|uniref:probable methyltransferase-like protein 24 isoform X2 n=1 Tax=Mercenaria mercenaria TaxID=6596 RepID=UPI00234EDA98|nr:probable methyltransferase-like protein 24 isoform X2 [Mercenaria mercenaria]
METKRTKIEFASNEGRTESSAVSETPKEVREVDGLPESEQIPGDEDLAKLDETTLLQVYWKYINMLQILCKDVIRVGNLKEGGKEICVDPGYKPEAPCLVYSFGINHLFDFDRDVVERFGCDVHCFDPSMKNETKRLSEHIWFYRWGLGGKNEINSKQWNMKTLDTIRRELGHTNRTIDLLKIDIEGDEWNAIPQMISSGALDDVRQISMETHFSAEHANQGDYWGNLPPHKQLSSLRQLYDFGYRTFMRERNMWSHAMWHGIKGFITNVNEISMIKPKR